MIAGKWSSSISRTAKGAGDISALAAPQARFDPDPLVATSPSCETMLATARVVEVFPFVPEIRMTSFPAANNEIASGSIAKRIRPGRVSPLFPINFDAALALLATAIAKRSLRLNTR